MNGLLTFPHLYRCASLTCYDLHRCTFLQSARDPLVSFRHRIPTIHLVVLTYVTDRYMTSGYAFHATSF